MMQATQAYAASATHRSLRDQEADVFRRVNGALRGATGAVARVRALADNRRLWGTVIDLLRDPENQLPVELRAAIVSLGVTVQREMDQALPDFEFLISINNSIVAGLSRQA